MASFLQASPPTPCAHLYPPPYAPHALPISFISILPPVQIIQLLVMQLSPFPCHLVPLRSKYAPQHPTLKYLLLHKNYAILNSVRHFLQNTKFLTKCFTVSVCLSVSYRCFAFAYVNAYPTHFPAQKIDTVAAQYSVRWANETQAVMHRHTGYLAGPYQQQSDAKIQCIIACQNRQQLCYVRPSFVLQMQAQKDTST